MCRVDTGARHDPGGRSRGHGPGDSGVVELIPKWAAGPSRECVPEIAAADQAPLLRVEILKRAAGLERKRTRRIAKRQDPDLPTRQRIRRRVPVSSSTAETDRAQLDLT